MNEQILFRYGYTDGKTWIFKEFSIEEIEMREADRILDIPMYENYKLTTRDRWTGLTDKNGVKVFEGDKFGDIYEDGWIEYCEKCKSLQYKIKDFGCMACEGDVHWNEIVESIEDGTTWVICNIHEKK